MGAPRRTRAGRTAESGGCGPDRCFNICPDERVSLYTTPSERSPMLPLHSLRWLPAASLAAGLLFTPHPMARAAVAPSMYSALAWRNVGPFRAGRVAAVSGAIGQPGVFYIGLPAGGI